MSGIEYPMYIVTAAAGDDRAGCLVGFVTQCSIEPARMLVCLSKANFTYRVAQRADVLAVHFLDQEDRELAALFGEETGDEVDKFARCGWQPGPAGVPLLDGTVGWVTGRIGLRTDCGDHVAHVLDPIDAEQRRPLLPATQLGFQSVKEMSPGHPAG